MATKTGIGGVLLGGIDVVGQVFGAKFNAQNTQALSAQSLAALQSQREFSVVQMAEKNKQYMLIAGIGIVGFIAYSKFA